MLPALRLVFNATALVALLALAVVLGVAAVQSQDLPWEHLALGRFLAEAGSIPKAESLLFTAPPSTGFDARTWAWDWTSWQAYHFYGSAALRWADFLAWLLCAWALAAAAFRRGARPFSTAIFTAWALLAARPDLTPGNGLLVFAGFCAALWIMEGDFWLSFFSRWIWLGPLAIVTVNCAPSAWALAPLALLWVFFDAGQEAVPRQPRLAKTLFILVLLVCLCVHPQGIAPLLRAPLNLAPSPLLPGAFGPRQGALMQGAVALLLLVASSWTEEGRAHLGRDAALLLAFGAAALLSRDALPYYLAVAAPLSAARFDALVDALPAPLRTLRWPGKVAALGALLAWTGLAGLKAGLGPAASSEPRPLQTLSFYEDELLNADILCPAAWTPYLAFKLAPNARFAVDGRGVAESGRAQALDAALNAQGDVGATLAKEGVELCWLPRGSPLALALATSQSWQPVSFDDASVVYIPKSPANADLIKTRAPRGLRPGDPDEPFDPTRLAQAEADLEADLAHDPGMGVVYQYMAQLWLARGHDAKSRETFEAGIRADPDYAPNYARLAALRAALGDAGDVDAARTLYRKALQLHEDAQWRSALAALAPA